MYSVFDYGRMLADRVRVEAYRAALADVVEPGSTVVDLGAGFGFFALEACRLGASRVYAIDTNDAIQLLPALARRNGFGDRIQVVQRPSTEVTLDRLADVIVADLRGVVPLYEGNVDILADARARWLAPGGALVPASDVLMAALVEAPELYELLLGGFGGHDVDLAEARALAANAFHHDRPRPLRADQLLTQGERWAEITYGERAPASWSGTIEAHALRAGVAHAVAVWFEARLRGAIGFSTAPGNDRVYGRAVLALEQPVALTAGEEVTLELCATRGARDHLWAWAVRTARAERRQSTFLGDPSPARAVAKEASSYAPGLGVAGRARAAILDAMDGRATTGEIAQRIHAAHPGAFASAAECLEETRKLARRYG
jgi:protein arginine N-methyltransferase 1